MRTFFNRQVCEKLIALQIVTGDYMPERHKYVQNDQRRDNETDDHDDAKSQNISPAFL